MENGLSLCLLHTRQVRSRDPQAPACRLQEHGEQDQEDSSLCTSHSQKLGLVHLPLLMTLRALEQGKRSVMCEGAWRRASLEIREGHERGDLLSLGRPHVLKPPLCFSRLQSPPACRRSEASLPLRGGNGTGPRCADLGQAVPHY